MYTWYCTIECVENILLARHGWIVFEYHFLYVSEYETSSLIYFFVSVLLQFPWEISIVLINSITTIKYIDIVIYM